MSDPWNGAGCGRREGSEPPPADRASLQDTGLEQAVHRGRVLLLVEPRRLRAVRVRQCVRPREVVTGVLLGPELGLRAGEEVLDVGPVPRPTQASQVDLAVRRQALALSGLGHDVAEV